MRSQRWATLAISASLAAGLCVGDGDAAPKQAIKSANPAHDKLMILAPAERAAVLARAIGQWCIGAETFAMGLVTAGQGVGNAYWSLRCADGTDWALQVDPTAAVTAIDCASFKESGAGKECFKKF